MSSCGPRLLGVTLLALRRDTDIIRSFLDPGANTPPGTSSSTNPSDASMVEKSLDFRGEQKPPRDVHGFLWALVVLSILSTTFLFGLDNTIVADVQPAIVERFGAISKLPWLSVAFLVGAASTNLLWSVAQHT